MEINDQNYRALQEYLQQTFNPATQKQAEQQLSAVEVQQGFPILLLKLISDENIDQTLRFAGALFFKNYVRRHWVPKLIAINIKDTEDANKIALQDRMAIKAQIVELMISVPEKLQLQISDALSIIAEEDFPENWENLLPFRTDTLFSNIKYVLDNFCQPYMQLFEITDKLITDNLTNEPALNILSQSLIHLIKIYYDLNCQDFPEFFEDNLATFSGWFQKYLVYGNTLLESQDEDEAGPLEKIKTGICEIIELYTQRYEEDFPQLPTFVPIVFDLLASSGHEAKYDTPAADEELFEDNPIEYIHRDLEGSDTDTRRRAAADFIRGLMERFEPQVTAIMSQYISHYLEKYNKNPQDNWKDKNTAIFLLVAIAARSTTAQAGATKVNALVNIVEFFTNNILSDLQSDVNAGSPILKVDAIKYLYTFRNQLTKEQLLTVFPLLVKHLQSNDYVVHTYAAIAIERILFIRQGRTMLFTSADIKPYAETLLSELFRLIELGQSPEKLSENDYLMKAVMRVIITSRQDMVPYVNVVMGKLTSILAVVSRNPSNPKFNHYIFESIGALIRFICPISTAAVDEFEKMLFGPFQTILSQDVQEFTPYVFQLLAQLLEQHTGQDLSQAYIDLLEPLLNPVLWEQGNIPALVRLLQAYLSRGVNTILSRNKLEPILGIFQQKLVNSRHHDHYALLLLNDVIKHVPPQVLTNYLPALVGSILKRLQTKKKGANIVFDRFTRNFSLWVCLYFSLDALGGPDTLIRVFDNLQQGLFGQIVTIFIAPDLNALRDPIDYKTCGIGIVRLLTQSDLMLQEPYASQVWPKIFTALLAQLELPPAATDDGPDELYTFDVEEGGYQTTFSKLTTSTPAREDPTASLPPCHIYLAQQLTSMSPEKRAIAKSLLVQVAGANEFLPKYFASAGIPLDQL
ncbi:importin-alpha export receptor [Apophysomyces ossiformis]|uniref:Importin-alpha export receptor n=1 Tax=Apophysomyces ossiformis TaxID=679940 RepID=A0A8H7ETZ5_9FUNG|nr:importin-alpha export receptor [Apophysomyces ossiformis]